MPLVGVYVDRLNRKLVIAISDTFQAFSTFSIISLFFLRNTGVVPLFTISAGLDMTIVTIIWIFTGVTKINYDEMSQMFNENK